ncbi:MAG TPA: hypothetical protein V6C65_29835 [Allocoleopsis sp.]
MTTIITDPEQWYADYEEASVKQQYDLFLEAISQPLTPEIIEDLDLGMLLVMIRDELVNHNQIDQALDLIQTIQEKQPDLYQQEFPFLENLRLEYALYRNNIDEARQALQPFLANPTEDIDQTLAILDYLVFSDAVDLAIDLAQAAYTPVEAADNVVLGTEIEFGEVLLQHQLQQAYTQLKAGEPIDWQAFLAEAMTHGLSKKSKWVEEVQHYLAEPIAATPDFFTLFKRDRNKALRALAVAFCQDMADQKQFSFVCSHAMWGVMCEFLEDRNLPQKKLSQPDLYFYFTQPQLDPYAAQKIGNLLSMQQTIGVGLVWSIPYIYDWLLAKQFIQPAVHQQAIEVATALKADFTNGYEQLWRYDFVHRWQRPDSVTVADFEAEAKQFADKLAEVTPLSDEAGHGTTRAFMEGLAQMLPPEARQQLEGMSEAELMALLREEDEDLQDEDDEIPFHSSSRTFDAYQPAKPRKSPLQLAAELPDRKNKPSNKKKKRGF